MVGRIGKREAGRCIFCGQQGSLSKQHILPDRLRHLIPRVQTTHLSAPFSIKVEEGEVVAHGPPPRVRNGHMGTKKLRIVCKPCNEGWMERVEHRAFESVEPLINGENLRLTKDRQDQISAFCAIMFTMVDREHLPTSGITPDEQRFIYENKVAPPNWRVFIGRVKSVNWEFRFRHHGLGMRAVDPKEEASLPKGGQICTVGLKNLLLHVVSNQGDHLVADGALYADLLRLKPIFPNSPEFDFHELKRLRFADANDVADGLMIETFRASATMRPGSK